MGSSDDVTNFDLIEDHKENIQSLPGGRSAKKLAQLFSPTPLEPLATPTPSESRTINDCIRAEYEAEVRNLAESDDPLDVFDRYVRWTLDAYPSAQATPESQLHTLLERATKTFVGAAQYKSDPRYLRLWMYYIQFFSDAPRETYMFLSRHGIGESLALYYEEYAAWLEGAGRWAQAEEVYQLGIEKEARPVQRLSRKLQEFQQRRARLPQEEAEEPSSPALPSLRPALAAKANPFGVSASSSVEPQASRPAGGASSKPKSKMAIFSDADVQPPATSSRDTGSKGWDSIGSIADRKKENTVEPKPWAGETLRAGGKKPMGKMAVFRDPSLAQIQNIVVVPSKHQVTVHPQTGKKEYIFVNLAVIYPTPEEPGTELSFEEVIAFQRGWLDKSWEDDVVDESLSSDPLASFNYDSMVKTKSGSPVSLGERVFDENGAVQGRSQEPRTGRKKKFMEVNETQIIKAKLDSPSGPRMRKRNVTSEPTMTMHTRAATDDIYDIFNAPLQSKPPGGEESGDGDDFDSDDNYTTDGESTSTTRQVDPDEPDEEEEEEGGEEEDGEPGEGDAEVAEEASLSASRALPDEEERSDADGDATEGRHGRDRVANWPPTVSRSRTTFIPIPPEDYEPPTRPYRDPVEAANNRLPFMTPITERTETSNLDVDPELPAYKTPCRPDRSITTPIDEQSEQEELSSPPSSPLRDILTEELSALALAPRSAIPFKAGRGPMFSPRKGPLIQELQCSPVDKLIREEILAKIRPGLSSYPGFFNHLHESFEGGVRIRRFAKALNKAGKGTARPSPLPPPVCLRFPEGSSEYTVKGELGAGAFAPVYLVERSSLDTEDEEREQARRDGVPQRGSLEALKVEDPPSAWEFYMMRLAHARLGPGNRATASVSYAHEMHLFRDETFLVLPLHPHGTLLDVVNFFRTNQTGVMDEQLAMFFSIELLRTMEELHSRGVLHGDLKPDNCLLRIDAPDAAPSGQWCADGSGGWHTRGLVLIDFGRGIDMAAFRPDVEFVADWKASVQDCPEMRDGRPWTWQIDYYGMAGVVHCLLFGKYIEVVRAAEDRGGGAAPRYRIRENLKRYWQTNMWLECFEVLLNPELFVGGEAGGKMPVMNALRGLRERMEEWLEVNCERGVGLKALLGKVEAFARHRR